MNWSHVRSLLLSAIFGILVACAPQPPLPSPGHISLPPTSPPKDDIPPPVQQSSYLLPPPSLPPLETYSVVINEVPVKQLLVALANDAGMNVDIYPGIEGLVTLNAIDQTLPQILERISKQVNLRYKMDGTNLIIYPDVPVVRSYKVGYVNMKREAKSEVSISTQIISNLNAGGTSNSGGSGGENNSTTKVINTSNNNFWDTLKANITAILTQPQSIRGSNVAARAEDVIFNPESGIITVRATENQHEEIQRFLDQVLESVHRQVLIEATVIEVQLSDHYQAGIDWQRIAGDYTYTQSLISGALGQPPYYLFQYQNSDGKFGDISMTLRLLERFGTVKVISSPRIMALNNQTAILKVVDNIVYFTTELEITETDQRARETYNTKINTIPVGLVMNITPQISDNEEIILSVRPTISRIIGYKLDPNPVIALAGVDNKVPEIQVREMESMLRISNGNIAVMGGLMQDTMDQGTTGVPVLSKLPLIGDLFTYRNDQYVKTELVIFLRPIIVKQASIEGDLRSYRSYLPNPSQPDTLPPTGLTRP